MDQFFFFFFPEEPSLAPGTDTSPAFGSFGSRNAVFSPSYHPPAPKIMYAANDWCPHEITHGAGNSFFGLRRVLLLVAEEPRRRADPSGPRRAGDPRVPGLPHGEAQVGGGKGDIRFPAAPVESSLLPQNSFPPSFFFGGGVLWFSTTQQKRYFFAGVLIPA